MFFKKSMSEDEYIKSFIKDCKKNKHWSMKLVPGKLKDWGCKKAAKRAWKKFEKNKPKESNSRFRTSSRLYEDLKLKW